MINWIKLKILNNLLNSCDIKEMADVIESFGYKQFGKQKDKYIESVCKTLVSLVVELNDRTRRK